MSEDFDTLDGYLGALWERKGSDLRAGVGRLPLAYRREAHFLERWATPNG